MIFPFLDCQGVWAKTLCVILKVKNKQLKDFPWQASWRRVALCPPDLQKQMQASLERELQSGTQDSWPASFLRNYIPSPGASIRNTLNGAPFPSVPAQTSLTGGGVEILFYTDSVLSTSPLLGFPLSLPSCPRVYKRAELLVQSSLGGERITSICADMSVSCPGPFHGEK